MKGCDNITNILAGSGGQSGINALRRLQVLNDYFETRAGAEKGGKTKLVRKNAWGGFEKALLLETN